MRLVQKIVGPLLALLLSGCANWMQAIPAQGEIGGQRLAATVDSEAARYYLENYLRDQRLKPELDAELDLLRRQPGNAGPTREELRALSLKYSTDFAALHFVDALARQPENQRLRLRFEQQLNDVRNGTVSRARFESNTLLLFVPAWNHENSRAFAGADFALPRALLTRYGIENRLIETSANGTIDANADIVARAIREQARGKRIILVSASMGSGAAALALGDRLAPHETCSVVAWLNIAGLLQGTPYADSVSTGPVSWFRPIVEFILGWNPGAIDSMRTDRSRLRFSQLRLPRHVLKVNYVGIPVSGTVSEILVPYYSSMRDEGPNDGLTLVADAILPDSVTLVALGRDHLLADDPDLEFKALALVRLLETELGTAKASCAPSAPAR